MLVGLEDNFMTYEEAKKEVSRLEALGYVVRMSIAVFGKTDSDHLYSVTIIFD